MLLCCGLLHCVAFRFDRFIFLFHCIALRCVVLCCVVLHYVVCVVLCLLCYD